MKRLLSTLVTLLSLLLFVGTCVLWFRSSSASDQFLLQYNRFLADQSPASSFVALVTDRRRAWVTVFAGRTDPYNGQLVSGYYINALNGGRPPFRHDRNPYDLSL